MFRTVTFLYVVFHVLARRVVQVAPLIQDQSADDAPVVKPSKSHLGTSFTELSAEPLDSSESPEADPLKTALPKKESKPLELPKCSDGTLELESGTYEVTQQLEIPERCNVNSNGAMLLLSAPLNFSKTARFKGKLSVKGLGSLEGPCFFFLKDAFIQSSAEIRFADCHNVAKDGDDAKGGAIHVRGDLTVTGNLNIHNSSARLGGGIFVEHSFKHLGGKIEVSNSSAAEHGGGIFVQDNFNTTGGKIEVSNSSAGKIGGGICVKQSFTNAGGEIQISGSSAKKHGGGIFVQVNFKHLGGNIKISTSSAKESGGGIYVKQSFTNADGEIQVSGSSAKKSGGGICVKQSFTNAGGEIQISNSSAERGGGIFVEDNFNNTGGNIKISNSSAEKLGGGIYVMQSFTNADGEIQISGSSAYSGGGIFVQVNFKHLGGNIKISTSSAKESGGGIYVFVNFANSGGKIDIAGSSAQKNGGGIFVQDNFNNTGGNIKISTSLAKESAESGGGIYVEHNFTNLRGNLSISGSSAEYGGGIYVEHSFKHLGGKIEVSKSSAERQGGGIYVYSNFTNSEGEIQISGSSAYSGGGIYVYDNFANSGGEIQISGSSAKEYGGGICVHNSFTNSEGEIQISGSSAYSGGGICVHNSFTNSEGEIQISGSSAYSGGGIYVYVNFEHLAGTIQISGSSAREYGGLDEFEAAGGSDGGAIYVRGNLIVTGNLSIHNCSADYGGGIYVFVNFANSGGKIDIAGSSAQKNGGGIYVHQNFAHRGGSLSVSDSSAKKDGGCLYVDSNAVFANATASFSQCQAQLQGGGILTLGNVSLTNASLMFELATADERSAALQASHLEQTGGDMTVYNSSASSEVISVTAWVIDGGTFHIQDCKAMSALMAAHQGARLNATEFVVSTSSGAGMLLSNGEVTMSSGIFNQTSSPQLRAKVVNVTHLNVTGSEASISWESKESTVHDMDCDASFGGYNRSDGVGCTKCDPGSVFVKNITEKTIANRSAVQHCVPCPNGTSICNATFIEMLPGMMVGKNISRGFHCPNPLACPRANISVNTNTSTWMCAPGYEGVGCAECTNDSARSNSNVFICLKCAQADDTWGRVKIVKDVFLFLASDAVIFIISAAGVVTAGRQNKNSKVYLNQLMSFAAVTAPALLALKSTINFVSDVSFEHQFKSLVTTLVQLIPFVSAPVQVGDAGASANNGSTACILRYLGMEPYLASSHFLSSVLYIVLTLSLAAKSGMSVAVVVGINCFLPKFVAAFGSYLICFTMEPAPFGKMHCLMGEAGPELWITMTRDKNLSDKPEVLFLTRSYRKGGEIGSKDGVEDNRLYHSNQCESIGADGLCQLGFGRIPFPPCKTGAIREG
eukprot:symbB.v1.2.030278.t1/scaffold3394.1/size57798/1